jgi:hypothetical protein
MNAILPTRYHIALIYQSASRNPQSAIMKPSTIYIGGAVCITAISAYPSVNFTNITQVIGFLICLASSAFLAAKTYYAIPPSR